VKVAAYQAPLLPCGSRESIGLIADRVRSCEAAGVDILCCPEGILGGLADYAARPGEIDEIAIHVERGDLQTILAPIASPTITTILGFTEIDENGLLFNAAAVFHRGVIVGIYRKRHPAINRSVYSPGRDTPVFRAGDLTFGIVVCRDSTYPEPVRIMADRGATALFVPTNNGMPRDKGGLELIDEARQTDITRARENGMWVIRSDVAGQVDGLVSYGSSGIVNRSGIVVQAARPFETGLLIADL
jgi:predicted amidohydrolase